MQVDSRMHITDGFGLRLDQYPQRNSETCFITCRAETFAWAPYKCKIPPRTPEQALIAIPSAKHVLWIGDSTTRGQFCRTLWQGLWGSHKDTICDLKNHNDKHNSKIITNPETREERNVSLSYTFVGQNLPDVFPLIQSLEPPPTHVIFNIGLYKSLIPQR